VFVVLTGFQLVNIATANYGFFCLLALALHLFLLRDDDLVRVHRWLARLPAWLLPRPVPADSLTPGRPVRALLGAFAAFYLAVSLVEGLARFTDAPRWQRWSDALAPLHRPLRAINNYHLFAQITQVRIEPELLVFDGQTWHPLAFHHKAGPLDRPPPFVAPHQPRLDFQLWFYGLSMRRPTPTYVRRLLAMLCHHPARAQPAFATPLPPTPTAVQLGFWRYTFTPPGADDWWQRDPLGETKPLRCADLPAP
jgi:lipase maturation factor 1